MSEYADIYVQKLSIASFCNYLNMNIVNLFFTKEDLNIISECKVEFEEDASYTQCIYKTTVKRARERLDASGYTISNFEKFFNENIFKVVDYSEFLYHLGVDYDDYENVAMNRIKSKVSFKKWKNAMHKIVSYELSNGNIYLYRNENKISLGTECEKIIYYSLISDEAESIYGLSTEYIDLGYIYRLILESCDENDNLILDFSNLLLWDSNCLSKMQSSTVDIEKTIVLVEGTSDKDILEFAMKQLYPHLFDLFYFMDFNDLNGGTRETGASYMVKNLKTFYFSKLKSKFIAIFDNDAEGYSSKCTLQNDIKNWPNNFRILLYPEIKEFRKYPTLATNGTIMFDDINRKACSIELYLPDILIKENDSFLPIEWEARKKIKYENGMVEFLYQGVISNKDKIKDEFHKLRRDIEKGKKHFINEDWNRMKQLLDNIVFAFVK